MLIFVLITVACALGLCGWIVVSNRRGGVPTRRGPREERVYALNTQLRVVDAPEQSTGRSFGTLLRAARGDRSAVEKWIVAEQYRGQVPVSREQAIEILAQRLQLSRG